jgi:hypothetical protein
MLVRLHSIRGKCGETALTMRPTLKTEIEKLK